MKVTLIYPKIGDYKDEARMEPLPLGALAGFTPPDVELALYDDRMEAIPYDDPTDLVGISVQIYTARRAYEISAAYRRRGVPVVMGGMHVTLIPQEAAQHADSIVISDAETIWAQVIEDARHGCLKPVYLGQPGAPQPASFTRRDLYRGKKYLPVSLLQFGRGCHFQCAFCATSAYFTHRHYYRSVEHTIEAIKRQGRKALFFVDDNIISDIEAAKCLFHAMIPLKVRWVSQASINMTADRELMELMVRSGCLGHVVGFESIDPQALRRMNKGQNLTTGFEQYKDQLEILRNYGLQTWAAFSLGHEEETPESIRRTLDFALRNKFTFAAFNILLPYPGTPLYEKLQAENRLMYDGKWWLHPDYRFNHAAFQPKNMTADELTSWSFYARSRFNSLRSIVYRLFEPGTNLRSPLRFGIYLAYNPLFRQEVFKKQGMALGDTKP